MRNSIHVITAFLLLVMCYTIGQHFYTVIKEKDEKISFYSKENVRLRVNLNNKKEENNFLKDQVIFSLKEISDK